MAYRNLIENLSKEIQLFQKMGGNIYSHAKSLPFYERIRSATKSYQRETGEKILPEQVYADCGIKFNKDYYRFSQFVQKLGNHATPEGFVDCIKRTNATEEQVEARSYLTHHSRQANLAPGEFLILMTDYRFENLTIAGDYVSYLQKRFETECPDGTVKNLKSENTSLHWALKHFQQYAPIELSYDEALAFFGIKNLSKHKPPEQKENIKINEKEVIQNLTERYPDGNIKNLFSQDSKLYFQVVKLSVKNDQTLSQWFEDRNFTYTQGNANARLSKYRVDAQEHEQMLLSLKEKYLSEYDTQNADEIDMYQINLEIAHKIGKELYGEKVEDSAQEEILENQQIDGTLENSQPVEENLQPIKEQITQAVTNTENEGVVQ